MDIGWQQCLSHMTGAVLRSAEALFASACNCGALLWSYGGSGGVDKCWILGTCGALCMVGPQYALRQHMYRWEGTWMIDIPGTYGMQNFSLIFRFYPFQSLSLSGDVIVFWDDMLPCNVKLIYNKNAYFIPFCWRLGTQTLPENLELHEKMSVNHICMVIMFNRRICWSTLYAMTWTWNMDLWHTRFRRRPDQNCRKSAFLYLQSE